jgi:serine/threonine protein phosphatase PrpC
MAVRSRLHSAFGSDTGRRRTNNEDRYFVDAERGIFAVVDGVGGHAAGEHAAETAVEVLRERLQRPTGTPEERLREAITLANNEIFRLAHTRPDWAGMACVLTVALIEDDVVTVGHVGDSRLYLLEPGVIEKKTHDHSPVGEREDRGELEELDAMRHVRRNEIYRDVGSVERVPDDPAFIEIQSFPLPDDGALLLCSDGLTDLITREEIRAGVERYAPDYDAAIAALIDAANHAGGKDNITVVLVASSGYQPCDVPDTVPTAALSRRPAASTGGRWLFALAGLLLGALLGFFGLRIWNQFTPPPRAIILVGPAGINAALNAAHPGDTVLIPQGTYKERVQLHEGVDLMAREPQSVILVSPDDTPIAVVAKNIARGSLSGVSLRNAGIEIDDASPVISSVHITGAQTGIRIQGRSEPLIVGSQIESELGAGILIEGEAKPKIERILITAAKPGIVIAETAHPVLEGNAILSPPEPETSAKPAEEKPKPKPARPGAKK